MLCYVSAYPLSISTFSPWESVFFRSFQKIVMSDSPPLKGPLTQTISPPKIETATSYLTAGPLKLWDHHLLLNGLGPQILKSVPSTVTRHDFPSQFRSLFSHLIYDNKYGSDILFNHINKNTH